MASRLKQIPESLLVKLWRDRAAREGYLRAGDGRRFRVVYPGRVSTTAGPDLRDAVLQQEGLGLVRGDVEVHVNQRDWDAHGHARDPRYNGVVLHVVGRMEGPYTRLHSGQRVPVLSLEHILQGEVPLDHGTDPWQLLALHGYSKPENESELAQLLDECGDARFLHNSTTFGVLLNKEEADQVLYAALMEALGYSQNREPFRELAYRVPYRRLRALALDLPPWDRQPSIRDELLSEAGLFSSSRRRRGSGPPLRWQTFRVRPQNHPNRRIAQFAHILDRFLPLDLRAADGPSADPIRDAVEWDHLEGAAPGNVTKGSDGLAPWTGPGLVQGMSGLLRACFNQCKVGNQRRARRPWRQLELGLTGTPRGATRLKEAGVGPGRARDMLTNCVLPFFHSMAQREGDSQLASMSLALYRSLPRLQDNELTREMMAQLRSSMGIDAGDSGSLAVGLTLPRERPRERPRESELERVVCSAGRQQGLIHLYELLVLPPSGDFGPTRPVRSEVRRGEEMHRLAAS